MSISTKWLAKESYEHSWSIAQIRAPISNVIESMRRSRRYKDSKQQWDGTCFEIAGERVGHIIVFSKFSSDWTFVEYLDYALLDYNSLRRISKNMVTDVLTTEYHYDSGGILLSHCKNGLIQEEYTTGNSPEDFPFKTTDGKKRKWETNDSKTVFRYGKRDTDLNLASSSFGDWWNEITDALQLEIPFLCWTNWESDNSVGVAAADASDVSEAYLMATS